MSRLSRIGLPLSMVSRTASRRECFCTGARQRVQIARALVSAQRLPSGRALRAALHRGVHIRR